MSDLIDKIARDRAEKLAPALVTMIREGNRMDMDGLSSAIASQIASAMREAVRLSGGTVPTQEREEPKKKYDPWAPNNNQW